MKNGKLKKLITLATVVASTFALVACGSSSSDDSKGSDSSAKKDSETVYRTLDEIKKDGTINIGVFSDKNPFGYVDENGEYQGYDVYFANRIGEDLGVKVNFVSTEAANRIEYLQTGKVDSDPCKLHSHRRACRRSRLRTSIHERSTWSCISGQQRYQEPGQLEQ